MCESQANPSKVLGVYEEWGWVSAKVYQVYANEFEVNYANASLSEVSASLSEVIQGKVQYCKEAKVQVNLDTISDQFCTVRWSVNLYFWSKCVQHIQNTINKAEIEKITRV